MPTPTKAQWLEIEKELSGMFGRVELEADGFTVVATVQTVAPLKQGIVIYVDGFWKGEWCRGEAVEARKFLQECKRYLWPAKMREQAKKNIKLRYQTAEVKEYWRRTAEDQLSSWSLYWTNAKAMTRHWRKTCTDIEIVKVGGGL
jgi:hypothetical protein